MIKWTAQMIILLAFVHAFAVGSGASNNLQSLSGIMKEEIKSGFKYYLELDGSTGKMNVSGEILKNYKPGDRVWIKGIIKTRLWNPVSDGTPQQQPVHWIIYMEVQEARKITTAFGL
jgi:hypothetical protein